MKNRFGYTLAAFGLILGLVILLATATKSHACPFCTMQGQTLTGEINQASLVLFGTLKNARLSNNPAEAEGFTDLEIEAVIKDNPILDKKQTITLKRYLPQDNKKPYKYLVFCDVFEKKIDPYRGVAFDLSTDVAKYLKGATAVAKEPIAKRLEFYFDFLDSSDLEVSNDAYKEFGNADYKDFQAMAPKLSASKVSTWIKDPKTPAFRLGLYASMLGHCGKKSDATTLRAILDDSEKRQLGSLDGILASYTMLAPKEGWALITELMKNEKNDFMLRWGALRAVRFFFDYRPDIIKKEQVKESLLPLLAQGDIADLAVEDLRKWKAWDLTSRILGIKMTESYKVAIVRRSVLRFAISASVSNEEAKVFVNALEKENPEGVKDAKELLTLEDQPPKPMVTPPKPKP
ncbi:MAG: hypothetical protein WCO91_03350 [Gemmataceae bacterium]